MKSSTKSNQYRPFACTDCGIALSEREVANESATYVKGTARSRVRSIARYCADCHARNEYARQQTMNSSVNKLLAKLSDEERAEYLAWEAAQAAKA